MGCKMTRKTNCFAWGMQTGPLADLITPSANFKKLLFVRSIEQEVLPSV